MSTDINPMLKMVAPLAQKFITEDNLTKVFDSLTSEYQPGRNEKIILVVSKKEDGTVMGSVASLYQYQNEQKISGVYFYQPIKKLIEKLLKTLN